MQDAFSLSSLRILIPTTGSLSYFYFKLEIYFGHNKVYIATNFFKSDRPQYPEV